MKVCQPTVGGELFLRHASALVKVLLCRAEIAVTTRLKELLAEFGIASSHFGFVIKVPSLTEFWEAMGCAEHLFTTSGFLVGLLCDVHEIFALHILFSVVGQGVWVGDCVFKAR